MKKKKNTYDTFDMVDPKLKEEDMDPSDQNPWTYFMDTSTSDNIKNEKKSTKEK